MQTRMHLSIAICLFALSGVLAQDVLSKLSKISDTVDFGSGADGVSCDLASNLTAPASCGVQSGEGWNFTGSGYHLEMSVPLPRWADGVQIWLPKYDLTAGKKYTLGFSGYGWPLSPFMINAVDSSGEVVATQKAAIYAGWGDKYMVFTPETSGKYQFMLNGFGNNIIVMTNQKAEYSIDNVALYEGAPPMQEIKSTGDTSLSGYGGVSSGSSLTTTEMSYNSVKSDDNSKSGKSSSSSSKSSSKSDKNE